MPRKKVLATALLPVVGVWEEQPNVAFLNNLTNELKKVAFVRLLRPSDFEEWTEAVKDVNIIAGDPKVNDSILKAADRLEFIQTFGIGYDNIDVSACTKKGVVVSNVAEVYSEPVAQHAWALILDLTKKVSEADRHMRSGTWQFQDWMGVQLWGKTLGVIGLGGIGSRVALKGRLGFNMKILAYDPYVLPERAQLFGVEQVSLERVFKESDAVVVCVPLTPQTRHLVSQILLSSMKKSAFLVNVCRGAVVDQSALIKCLQNNDIKGAGLDVFEVEPLPQDSPLLKMENVILTPHIASSTKEAVEKTYADAVANIIRYIKGESPYWIVNPHQGKR